MSQNADKNRAKRILVEIIRQNGGAFTLKTNLYKAFYHAHLRYAEKNRGYLSQWPIVRMPRGPGIDRADMLLSELVSEGLLEVKDRGGYDGFSFAVTERGESLRAMKAEEVRAIRYGVKYVSGKTAKQNSDDSHLKSRSWRAAHDGEELDIYTDISDAPTHRKRAAFFKRVGAIIDGAF